MSPLWDGHTPGGWTGCLIQVFKMYIQQEPEVLHSSHTELGYPALTRGQPKSSPPQCKSGTTEERLLPHGLAQPSLEHPQPPVLDNQRVYS